MSHSRSVPGSILDRLRSVRARLPYRRPRPPQPQPGRLPSRAGPRRRALEGAAAALRKAFVEANAGIHAIGQGSPEFRGMGTTATALLLRPEGAWLGHVGDSRVYRIRDGRIEQLTFDHSAIWEIARRQKVKPEELHGIPSDRIVRALGPD